MQSSYFHVIFAGVRGGGRCLTGLREHIGSKGYVIPSLSTAFGLKRGEYRLKTHYANLADEIVKYAQGKSLRIYAHSFGSIEALDFMRVLATKLDLPHQSLEVFFISLPGVGQKGVRGMGRVGKRFAKLIQTLGRYDQYHILPLPSEGDDKALQKRQVFLEEWLPRVIRDNHQQVRLKQTLQHLDQQLLFLAAAPNLQPDLKSQLERWCEQKRHKLMKGLLEKIIAGEHILDEIHLRQLNQCREDNSNRASRLGRLLVGLHLIARTLNLWYHCVDARLIAVVEDCRKMGVDLKIGLVILGKDELVYEHDYSGLISLATAKNIPIAKYIFDREEHASVAYKWELIDALEALDLRDFGAAMV